MNRVVIATVWAALVALVVSVGARTQGQPAPSGQSQAARAANPDGWQIPPTAAGEKNPVALSDKTLADGKKIFASKCQRCHGPGGHGDGPDADPDHRPDDLTDGARAARNPDGVMFYKVWNGRKKPKMPAFDTELSKDEVWTVIHFVKTLRK
jgi:mono/diheme cytochrome c family protein